MGSDRPPPPRRPRLADHVLPRRHVIDGTERVVLHDQHNDEVVQVGPREWAVLEAADGTREPEGIVVAARRRGAHARVAAVSELLHTLAERGMVEAGEEAEPEARSSSARKVSPRPFAADCIARSRGLDSRAIAARRRSSRSSSTPTRSPLS